MKTKIFIIAGILLAQQTIAQLPEDALRFSWITSGGSARNQAIGGAMGSLGGDITATYVNPAGIGLYRTGEMVISPGFAMLKNKTNFRGTDAQDNKNSFNYGASGFVLGSKRWGKWSSHAFSIAVNKTADFNSNLTYKGLNTNSSYAEKYIEELSRNRASVNEALNNSAYAFGSGLAAYTYLVDTFTLGGVKQWLNLSAFAPGLNQSNIIETRGGMHELAMAYALNMDDKIYVGGSIGVPIISYERNSTYREEDASTNALNNFKYFEIKEKLKTRGLGINAKLGMIVKPVEYIRIGLALHSPTFMSLTDNYSAEMNTDTENYAGFITQKSSALNGGNEGEAKYLLTTPWKAILSASYVFREVENVKRQRAFITADVEYVNYKANSFSEADDNVLGANEYYNSVNATIDQEYKSAFNVRLGGEIKFNTIMARLGFALYGNPYKDTELKSTRKYISGGLGYRHKGMFIDLTYVHGMGKDVNFPYRLEDKANTYANIRGIGGNVIMTLGFKLY
jgi:hypothetical protein